jgi:vacuolar-type H+-ATPase subunit H
MDKGILNEVIDAEKDIQACIELEQARLREMLERTRREAEETVAAAERELTESRDRELEAARQEAEARARKTVEDASGQVARLDRVDDRTLTGIILKRIPRILME